jgi:hypothetical protein
MNIEVVNKIEIRVGEDTLILSKFEVVKLIKQLQEVIEYSPASQKPFVVYPPGVRSANPRENTRADHGEIPDVNMGCHVPQEGRIEARTATVTKIPEQNIFIRDVSLASLGY